MKKLILLFLALLPTLTINARVDVDFSSRFDEGTNTITCPSAWGWYSVDLRQYEVEDCDYLYLSYSSSCNFNLVLQNESWQNQYQLSCKSGVHEVVIKLTDVRRFSCVVIQNHAEGEVTVEDPGHPVMAGVSPKFIIHEDEWYTYNRSPRPHSHVLASVNEDSYTPASDIRMGDHPVIWTNPRKSARNVYFQIGHSASLFDNPDFVRMFTNALCWGLRRQMSPSPTQ